ncbi:hypothetical protein SAG0136_07335 [Streptococcus agalactiae LMG 14747]|uniref:Uncharacterized protein n=1 Tax=Streptococcus agalactiae LMG 14747 TaxID=1154860 RepID=V6Z2B6_STRAG|nr:hypothetical protein SAG0136_07335 [Streptococcus agalactiae LMG 14747]
MKKQQTKIYSKKEIQKGFFLPFVKPIKVFDEKYFEFNSQNKEIVFFWTKVSCQKEYTKLRPYVEGTSKNFK